MEMFKVYLKWFFFNSVFMSLFIYSHIVSNENLINVSVFFFWVFSILPWLYFNDKAMEERIKQFNSGKKFTNKNLDLVVDLFMTGVIVYFGYVFLAVFYIIHAFIIVGVKSKIEKGEVWQS